LLESTAQAETQQESDESDDDADDDINDKELINTSLDAEHNRGGAKPGPDDLTDAEAQCYMDRFSDLSKHFKKKKNPLNHIKIHYKQYGKKEGRNKDCANDMTDQQALCYLKQHADLTKKFGTDIVKGRKHFLEFGAKEGRNYKCAGIEEPKFCSEEMQDCTCGGIIHFANKFNSIGS
jgi:hypothetical protein